MGIFTVYYIGLKAAFLYALVRSFVKFENLQKHWLFMGLFYAAGVVFLSWVWFVAPQEAPDYRPWQVFWIKTGVLSVIYFKLLERFDEGPIFWMLLVSGLGLVYF